MIHALQVVAGVATAFVAPLDLSTGAITAAPAKLGNTTNVGMTGSGAFCASGRMFTLNDVNAYTFPGGDITNFRKVSCAGCHHASIDHHLHE